MLLYKGLIKNKMWRKRRGSNNGVSLEAGRSCHVKEVLSEVPDKGRQPGCPGWGLDLESVADTFTS